VSDELLQSIICGLYGQPEPLGELMGREFLVEFGCRDHRVPKRRLAAEERSAANRS
jgi:hypothetical protein